MNSLFRLSSTIWMVCCSSIYGVYPCNLRLWYQNDESRGDNTRFSCSANLIKRYLSSCFHISNFISSISVKLIQALGRRTQKQHVL